MTFFAWRFWNTCVRQNEKTAHTCRYICEPTPKARGLYICNCRGTAFRPFARTHWIFQILRRFKAKQLSSMSLFCVEQRCKYKESFWKKFHCEHFFFTFVTKLMIPRGFAAFHFVPFRERRRSWELGVWNYELRITSVGRRSSVSLDNTEQGCQS